MRSENRKEYGVIAVTAFAFALTNERTALLVLAASLLSLVAYDFVCEKLRKKRLREEEKHAAEDATLHDESEDDYEYYEPCDCPMCLQYEADLEAEAESRSAVTGEEEIGQR